MSLSPALLWLLIGAVALVLEVMGVSGIGLLFAGIGAFFVGILIETGIAPADGYLIQVAWWFLFTALSALLLWKPFRRLLQRQKHHYSNMIGDTAVIGPEGLKPGETGHARWSGTIMQARLAPHCAVDSVAAGAQVRITGVQGATLLVEPL